MLWWMFTDPAARTVLVDWEAEAAALLARYRAAVGRHPDDPAFEELTDRLHAASCEVRAWWPRHDIAHLSSGTKRLRHPDLGELEFQHVVLQVADDPEQKLVTFAASSDEDQTRIAKTHTRLAAGRLPAPLRDPLTDFSWGAERRWPLRLRRRSIRPIAN